MKEKRSLSKKKIGLNSMIICILLTLIVVLIVMIQNTFNLNDTSLSLSNKNTEISSLQQNADHLRYITKDTMNTLSDNSSWNTDSEKKKLLEDALNKNIDELLKNKKIILNIDFKPALSEEKLDERILRDFKEFKNKQFKHALDKLLPQKMIPIVIEKTKINEEKRVNEITKEERKNLVKVLKKFELTIKDFRPVEEAIITSGGINIKEINPKTMESKLVKGLYFAGEIIDVDSYTGGFNLQIAYSTGYTAGMHIGDLEE